MTPQTKAGRALLDNTAPLYKPNPCKHKAESWFDRTFCACGAMHDMCVDCAHAIGCPLDKQFAVAERRTKATLPIHAIEAEAAAQERARLRAAVARQPAIWLRDSHGGGLWVVDWAAVLALLDAPEETT